MRLMIDSNATPTAHHSPIPVPLHWQDDIKAGLNRDVRLGVLELVSIGETITWCHRMVRLGVLEPAPIGEPVTWCHRDVRLGVLDWFPLVNQSHGATGMSE